MKRPLELALGIIASLAATAAHAVPPANDQSSAVIFENVRIFDGTADRLSRIAGGGVASSCDPLAVPRRIAEPGQAAPDVQRQRQRLCARQEVRDQDRLGHGHPVRLP